MKQNYQDIAVCFGAIIAASNFVNGVYLGFFYANAYRGMYTKTKYKYQLAAFAENMLYLTV